jgi:ribonuclease P protein component
VSLPKQHRLRRRQDFSVVYRHGLSRSSSHLTLRARARSVITRPDSKSDRLKSELEAVQIGISISQKVSKRAVVRNRIKRRIRAAFRCILPTIKPGWQIVVVVKPSAIECDYHQILQELKQLLDKAEVRIDGN